MIYLVGDTQNENPGSPPSNSSSEVLSTPQQKGLKHLLQAFLLRFILLFYCVQCSLSLSKGTLHTVDLFQIRKHIRVDDIIRPFAAEEGQDAFGRHALHAFSALLGNASNMGCCHNVGMIAQA